MSSADDVWNAMGYTEYNPLVPSMRVVRDAGLQSWGRMDVGNGVEVVVAPLTFPNPHSRAVQEGQPVKNCGCGWCNGVRERIARHARGDPCNCQECLDTVSPQSSLDRGLATGGPNTRTRPGDTLDPNAPSSMGSGYGGPGVVPGPIPLDLETMSHRDALMQVTTPSGRYYIPEIDTDPGRRYPSITTVLKEYAGPNAGLKAWEERVGAEEAKRVRERASWVGDTVHAAVAAAITEADGPQHDDADVTSHVARIMDILRERVRRVYAIERRLYHPLGMAGTVDLVCDWVTDSGEVKLAVVDYKTKGPKGMHPAALDGYFLQCTLYAQAWKTTEGHTPNHLVIIESAAGAGAARAHEGKAYPHQGPLPSGYTQAINTRAFIEALIRSTEACKKW